MTAILIVIACIAAFMLFFVLALVRGTPETSLEEQAECLKKQAAEKDARKRRRAEKRARRRGKC